MAKKLLTRTLDTSTAEGQEAALRLLQQATQIQQPAIDPIVQEVVTPIVEAEVETEAPPPMSRPKRHQHPNQKLKNAVALPKATQTKVAPSNSLLMVLR